MGLYFIKIFRVTFGDQQLGCYEQPHLQVPTTDTSLKMNQLAAKYLKNAPPMAKTPSPKPVTVDMSIATRNYMEKHKLLQGQFLFLLEYFSTLFIYLLILCCKISYKI